MKAFATMPTPVMREVAQSLRKKRESATHLRRRRISDRNEPALTIKFEDDLAGAARIGVADRYHFDKDVTPFLYVELELLAPAWR